MIERMYFRGGPKDGLVELGEVDAHTEMVFLDPPGPSAYYRATDEIEPTKDGPLRVAEYVGDKAPGHRDTP